MEGLFQPTHLILILIMILIVFGPGKLPDVGAALGRGIREFRGGLGEPGEREGQPVSTPPGAAEEARPGSAPVACPACGAPLPERARFCPACGAPVERAA